MSKARANADATSQAYIENATATQNLSGTYSTERLYFNDSYTLTGDVTVTGHLALGTVADSDVVITQDSTERTITGSGTLESGNVLQDTHRTSLTDMTGELGSVVTGTLGSGINFPTGHIINTISRANRAQTYHANDTATATDCYHNITTTNGNYVWVTATCPVMIYGGSALPMPDSVAMTLQIRHSTDNGVSDAFTTLEKSGGIQGEFENNPHTTDKIHGSYSANETGLMPQHFVKHSVICMQFLHGPVTGTAQYYKVYVKYTGHEQNSGPAAVVNPDSNAWGSMTLSEVQA